jgi:hypothetical protein
MGASKSAAGAQAQGVAAQQAAQYQMLADRAQGKADFGAAQRSMIGAQQKADLVQGKQLADAAHSGGGVVTPSVLDIYKQTAGRGANIAESDLYPGQQRQWSLNTEGDNALYRGNVAKTAADTQAQTAWLQGLTGAAGSLSKADWGKIDWKNLNFGS